MMVNNNWIIKKVKYDGIVMIVFSDEDSEAEYSLKCEENPKPEFVQALRNLRDHFIGHKYNPLINCDPKNQEMAIHTVNYRYKDGELDKVNFTCTVRNHFGREGEMTIPNILIPTHDSDIDKDLDVIAHEANEYIAGHRAQMGLWEGEEHVD